MIHSNFKITVSRQRLKTDDKLNSQLQFFARSLGLFNDRDKDNSCFRVFIEFLKFRNKHLSSDEIAFKTDLTRGTVVHHIHRLMESGLIVQDENKYLLRVESLKRLIKEIKKDIDRLMSDMELIADDIDSKMGLSKEDDLFNIYR